MVVVYQPVLVQRQGEPVLGGPGKLCLSLRSNVVLACPGEYFEWTIIWLL